MKYPIGEKREQDLFVAGDPDCAHDFKSWQDLSGAYQKEGGHFGFLKFWAECRNCDAVVGRRTDVHVGPPAEAHRLRAEKEARP